MILDPVQAPEPRGRFDHAVLPLLNDPRDLVFVRLMAGCSVVVVAGIALFLVPKAWVFWMAPAYWLLLGAGYLDRFILMLHCTSHRQLFRARHRWLNRIIPWVLGPFFGETPETYFVHHMGMHHPENNLEADLSSTMRYQRDRLLHWLLYFGTFLVAGLPLLCRYHHRKQNRKLLWRALLGEGAFLAGVALLALWNWRATLVVFVVPLVAVRALMMAGNWGQHAFVDAVDPGNAYKNSITCINTRYNRRAFNDGYHILHHLRPRTHWTEYPVEFQKNLTRYGAEDAIVFEGIDFFQVWFYLMLGRYRALARRFVRLPGAPPRSDEEVVVFLKSRLRPIRRDLEQTGAATAAT